jgi:hypothetical protein
VRLDVSHEAPSQQFEVPYLKADPRRGRQPVGSTFRILVSGYDIDNGGDGSRGARPRPAAGLRFRSLTSRCPDGRAEVVRRSAPAGCGHRRDHRVRHGRDPVRPCSTAPSTTCRALTAELATFAHRLTVKREDRLARLRRPSVRVVAPAAAETAGARVLRPGRRVLSDGHAWARIEARARAGRCGRFHPQGARPSWSVIGGAGCLGPPGDPLFEIRRGTEAARVCTPVSGVLVQVRRCWPPTGRCSTTALRPRLGLPARAVGPRSELARLRIGRPLVEWYQEEIARLRGGTRIAGGLAGVRAPSPAGDAAPTETGALHRRARWRL